MKLYIHKGLDGEEVPWDVTHVIVDDSVTVIKESTFSNCEYLISLIMGDKVKRIEGFAIVNCPALRFIRLSKALEYIGSHACCACCSLEVLFLPSTLKSIEERAFSGCRSLRLLILPPGIDLNNVGKEFILHTVIRHTALAGLGIGISDDCYYTNESTERRADEWLIHHMDEAPFHKLCCNSSITTQLINDYLIEHGEELVLATDPYHGMTPLHMLTMNPHAPSDAIAALLDANIETSVGLDNKYKTPLDYARDYNVDGMIAMINGLCNHRNATVPVPILTTKKNTKTDEAS